MLFKTWKCLFENNQNYNNQNKSVSRKEYYNRDERPVYSNFWKILNMYLLTHMMTFLMSPTFLYII